MAPTVEIQAQARWLDEEWNQFALSHPHGHLLQSCEWAQFKSRHAWSASRVLVRENARIVAGAQVLFRKVSFASAAYAPKGPIVDWENRALVQSLMDGMRQLCRKRRAVFLRVEPDLPDDPILAKFLLGLGFRFGGKVQPLSTLVLDINRDLEEILASMKPKTRYNIRLAERKGVRVREAAENDVAAFYRLSQTTSLRDDFPIHAETYFLDAYRTFVPTGLARLFLAEYEGEAIAGLMAFAFGSAAWYMYGASSNRHRNVMPNHLLQWHAIQWAKAKGCKTYDFWGIPDEVGQDPTLAALAAERSDGLWGVYRFKEGFGGHPVRYLGAYDDVCSPIPYALGTRVLPRLRQMIYKMRRRPMPDSGVNVG